jgi:hypothetical protein
MDIKFSFIVALLSSFEEKNATFFFAKRENGRGRKMEKRGKDERKTKLYSSFGTSSFLFLKYHTIHPTMPSHTMTRHPASTHPSTISAWLFNTPPIARVAVASAVLGKTKLHQVIWKGMWEGFGDGFTYFHSEPRETRRNQRESPHSGRPRRTVTTRIMGWISGSGIMREAWRPRCTENVVSFVGEFE